MFKLNKRIKTLLIAVITFISPTLAIYLKGLCNEFSVLMSLYVKEQPQCT